MQAFNFELQRLLVSNSLYFIPLWLIFQKSLYKICLGLFQTIRIQFNKKFKNSYRNLLPEKLFEVVKEIIFQTIKLLRKLNNF